MNARASEANPVISTLVPARLDRLPWSAFHWRVVIGTGSRVAVFYGYLAAAALMLIAVAVVLALGVNAERKPLEEVAPPLSADTP